jgi:hypothetical protein
VLLIGLLECFFYNMLPTQLGLMMVAAALVMRELGAEPARAGRGLASGPAVRSGPLAPTG